MDKARQSGLNNKQEIKDSYNTTNIYLTPPKQSNPPGKPLLFEEKPESPPANGNAFFESEKLDESYLDYINELYEKVRRVPYNSRRFLYAILENGEIENNSITITPTEISLITGLSSEDVGKQNHILNRKGLSYYDEDDDLIHVRYNDAWFSCFIEIVTFAKEKRVLDELIISCDFTLLDS